MRKRITAALVALVSACLAALFLPFLAGSANAATLDPTQPCRTTLSDVPLGQSVEAYCPGLPGEGTYQVVAECASGGDVWTVPGTVAEYGEYGPSVAVCHGILLFPAHVRTYYVQP